MMDDIILFLLFFILVLLVLHVLHQIIYQDNIFFIHFLILTFFLMKKN